MKCSRDQMAPSRQRPEVSQRVPGRVCVVVGGDGTAEIAPGDEVRTGDVRPAGRAVGEVLLLAVGMLVEDVRHAAPHEHAVHIIGPGASPTTRTPWQNWRRHVEPWVGIDAFGGVDPAERAFRNGCVGKQEREKEGSRHREGRDGQGGGCSAS